MIRVSDLAKNFGDNRAVDDLSFTVNKGEIYGIVGPDGAGKSTLLRMIAGILSPDSGAINVGGIDVVEKTYVIKENLAYMPQKFGLYEDLTVEENLFFFGKLFGVSGKEIKKRMPALYEFSRLGPFSGRLAGNLSGGMKQKLGLACCLVHRPGLILLDEPTNGVDPVSRREFWKILYDLLAGGVTIVVSTAYLDEAERCNRVALMHEGRFLVSGTPPEIKASIKMKLVEINTDDVWKAEMVLRGSENHSNVFREGNALRLFLSDIKKESAEIKKILTGTGVTVLSLKEKQPNLENCFMEIIKAESAR